MSDPAPEESSLIRENVFKAVLAAYAIGIWIMIRTKKLLLGRKTVLGHGQNQTYTYYRKRPIK